MNSSHDADKIKRLNELITSLKSEINAYNQFTRPILSLRAELRALDTNTDKPNQSKTRDQITENISLFSKRLEDDKVKTLEKNIEKLTQQIEALEIDIYGKSHRDSPTFLTLRK